jgi:hypothetical protein
VKIILQTQNGNNQITPGRNYKGFFDVLTHLYQQEGLIGLFRGNLANCAKFFITLITTDPILRLNSDIRARNRTIRNSSYQLIANILTGTGIASLQISI